jgi:hypothetical protein
MSDLPWVQGEVDKAGLLSVYPRVPEIQGVIPSRIYYDANGSLERMDRDNDEDGSIDLLRTCSQERGTQGARCHTIR